MADFPTTAADDLELLRSCAVTAGILATGYFRREIKSWTKEHDSPVSEADIVLDDYLRAAPGRARPDYGWLSEETADTIDQTAEDVGEVKERVRRIETQLDRGRE